MSTNEPDEPNSTDTVGDEYHQPDFDFEAIEAYDAKQQAEQAEQEDPEPPEGEYVPYDLAQARPSRFDPVDENGNPAKDGKPRLRDEEGNVLPEFDERYKEDFYGLAFVGALSKTFTWLGHRFTIRTITVQEALWVSLLTKQFGDTIGNGLAYRTAVACLAVQRVDGQDLPIPIGDEADFAYAQQRFDYATNRWFQFTVDAIYNEYLELELRTRQVVDAMGKAFGQTASTSG